MLLTVWAGLDGNSSLSPPLGVSWDGSKPGGRNHLNVHSLLWWLMLVSAGTLSGRLLTWLGLPHNIAAGLTESILELTKRERAS